MKARQGKESEKAFDSGNLGSSIKSCCQRTRLLTHVRCTPKGNCLSVTNSLRNSNPSPHKTLRMYAFHAWNFRSEYLGSNSPHNCREVQPNVNISTNQLSPAPLWLSYFFDIDSISAVHWLILTHMDLQDLESINILLDRDVELREVIHILMFMFDQHRKKSVS